MTDRKKSLILIIIATCIVLLLILFTMTNYTQKEFILAENIKEEVLIDIEKAREYETTTLAWAEEQAGKYAEHLDIGYLSPPENHRSGGGNPRFEPIKYLIAGVTAKDRNIFLSSFHPETIMTDMENINLNEGLKLLDEIMDQISRNGRLEGIYIEEVRGIFNTLSNEIELTLVYTDNVEIITRIELTSFKDEHHNENYYVIATSMREIIEQIKTAL